MAGWHHRPICWQRIGAYWANHPDQIEEYIEEAKDEEMTPDEYVRSAEGTYNRANGHFTCTDCYIKMGMPAKPYPETWVAP